MENLHPEQLFSQVVNLENRETAEALLKSYQRGILPPELATRLLKRLEDRTSKVTPGKEASNENKRKLRVLRPAGKKGVK